MKFIIILLSGFLCALSAMSPPDIPAEGAVEVKYALQFEGSDTWIETPLEMNFGDEFTIEAWIKPGEVDKWQSYVSLGGYAYPYLLAIHASGRTLLGYSYRMGAFDYTRTATGSNLEAGFWVHMALTKEHLPDDGALMKLYLNGEKDIEAVLKRWYLAPSGNLWVSGFSSGARRKASGLMRDIRVWETARTGKEIRENMDLELSGREEGLIAYWKLNEGEGSKAFDSSPNKHHARITGARWAGLPAE